MSSKIEWTGSTWNPIRARVRATGAIGHMCEKISAGCRECYAERLQRWPFHTNIRYGAGDRDKVDLFLDLDMLVRPARWQKPTTIFVCSMTDLFYEQHPFEWIDAVFSLMEDCPHHTFQVLTKRPERAYEYLLWKEDQEGHSPFKPLPNVWMGTTIENEAVAHERHKWLMCFPAAVHFWSAEPLLSYIDAPTLWALYGKPDLIITGGESGSKARPMHPDWPRRLRDDCEAAESPFFFKQWGEWVDAEQIPEDATGFLGKKELFQDRCLFIKAGKRSAGRLLDGVEHNAMP